MRRLFFPVAVILFLTLNARSADHSQLMGVWRIDPANSPIVDGKLVKSGALTIDYHRKWIHWTEVTKFENGDRTVEMECYVDGQSQPLYGTAYHVRAKWEGSSLVASGAIDGGDGTVELSVSPDGLTLTEVVHHTDGGQFDRTLVWKRP
jgi:hypothetical protein